MSSGGLGPVNTNAGDLRNPSGVAIFRYVPGRWVTKTPGDIGYTWGMAWKETCVMNERIKMIGAWMGGDYAVSELAAEYGISRKTAYKWIERFEAGGASALEDRSRAPRHHPNAVAQ